jgi:hypothetical protein
MWSVVGAGSVRHDSEELATSFVRYQGTSDGSAEVRTAQGGSSLAAREIWDQVISWCRDHDVTQPKWSVIRGCEPRAFPALIRALGGVFADSTEVLVADIDAALALPAAATAMRAEIIETGEQLAAADAVTGRLRGSAAAGAEIEARVRSLAILIGTRTAFGVLARDPSGAAVSVGECTLEDGVARLSGAYTLEAHRGRGAYTAVLRQRLATAGDAGATIALARGLAATSAPILMRNGFARYATWDKYTITLIPGGRPRSRLSPPGCGAKVHDRGIRACDRVD